MIAALTCGVLAVFLAALAVGVERATRPPVHQVPPRVRR